MFQRITTRTIHVLSTLLMIFALSWLTVSLPFVARAKQHISSLKTGNPDKDDNTATNTTEEKASQTINEEYLHHEELSINEQLILKRKYVPHLCPDLPHFHFELITPPPEA